MKKLLSVILNSIFLFSLHSNTPLINETGQKIKLNFQYKKQSFDFILDPNETMQADLPYAKATINALVHTKAGYLNTGIKNDTRRIKRKYQLTFKGPFASQFRIVEKKQ